MKFWKTISGSAGSVVAGVLAVVTGAAVPAAAAQTVIHVDPRRPKAGGDVEATLDQALARIPALRRAGYDAFAAACLSFSPVSPREAADIHAQVRDRVGRDDVVYADMSAYFDARARGRYVYAFTFANNHFLPGFPTAGPVTKLIVQAGDASGAQALLGLEGWVLKWRADKPLAVDQKPLEIWRRSTLHAAHREE